MMGQFLIESHGHPVRSVKTALAKALKLAGITGTVSPHTLRHTAATWLMQAGIDKWEAAKFLGMSVEMPDRVYGHHHPDHLRRTALALGYRPRQSLAITLAVPPTRQPQATKALENIGGSGRSTTIQQIQ
jgi:integrase